MASCHLKQETKLIKNSFNKTKYLLAVSAAQIFYFKKYMLICFERLSFVSKIFSVVRLTASITIRKMLSSSSYINYLCFLMELACIISLLLSFTFKKSYFNYIIIEIICLKKNYLKHLDW